MRPKIGIVIDPWHYPYNGTVVSTRRFVAALDSEVDFRLLAIEDDDTPIDERIFGFPRLSIPGVNGIIDAMKVPLARPASRANIAEGLRGLDLVHMQFPFFLGAAVCRQAKRLGLPLICSFHVQPENLLYNLGLNSKALAWSLYKLFIWAMYRYADLVITPSHFAAEQLRKHGLKVPIEVLSNGVPAAFFELSKPPSASENFLVLSVGRMAPEKRHDLILSAVSQSRFRDKIQLRLIGTGPLEAKLKRQAAQLGLNAELGPVTDDVLMAAYRDADLFVHAGEVELEGMSVLEAMASGNAVLVSDSTESAANQFVTDPEARFKNRDLNDLTARIDAWLSCADKRQQAGAMNRTFALSRHHQNSAAQLLSIYRRFLPANTDNPLDMT